MKLNGLNFKLKKVYGYEEIVEMGKHLGLCQAKGSCHNSIIGQRALSSLCQSKSCQSVSKGKSCYHCITGKGTSQHSVTGKELPPLS